MAEYLTFHFIRFSAFGPNQIDEFFPGELLQVNVHPISFLTAMKYPFPFECGPIDRVMPATPPVRVSPPGSNGREYPGTMTGF